jgi:hypothetical protein
MQYSDPLRALAASSLALWLAACTNSPVVVRYDDSLQTEVQAAAAAEQPQFELFTTDPRLYQAALRARERISAALGESGIALADLDTAARCRAFQPGCGFPLEFADVVYCYGNPDPALACTSQGVGGTALSVRLQTALAGAELDNRLIHELFHVITLNSAPHSLDGLFMEYSVGDERISQSTLSSVCDHFACSRFVLEEGPSGAARGSVLSRP